MLEQPEYYYNEDRGQPNVYYDPWYGYTAQGQGRNHGPLHFSPLTVLGHELGHRDPKDPKRRKRDDPGGGKGGTVTSGDNVGQIENPLRDWLGYPRRYYY